MLGMTYQHSVYPREEVGYASNKAELLLLVEKYVKKRDLHSPIKSVEFKENGKYRTSHFSSELQGTHVLITLEDTAILELPVIEIEHYDYDSDAVFPSEVPNV